MLDNYDAVEFILGSINELVSGNTNIYLLDIIAESDEVQNLVIGLQILQGLIKQVPHDRTLMVHVRQGFAETAKDAIENYVLQCAKYIAKNPFQRFFSSRPQTHRIRSIARDVQIMNTNVTRNYILRDFPKPKQLKEELWSTRNVEERNVVGFDIEVEDMIQFLLGDSLELGIYGVVGMAGVGKTTLVNKIYKHEKIVNHFTHRAWICVWKYGCEKDIFVSLLKQFGFTTKKVEEIKNLEFSDIVEVIRSYLVGKKYLIVLDDVCDEKIVTSLKEVLPKDPNCSRILLTTRCHAVTKHFNNLDSCKQLRFLDTKESWELLQKLVFGELECPHNLTSLGQEIAAKCGGLPLAIGIIAQVLYNNKEDVWKEVAGCVCVWVNESSNFNKVVSRSFNSLSYNKKMCFLYLGIFPRGPIPVWKLIRLWIAEGLLQGDSLFGMENEATSCLDELIDLNLVMVTSMTLNGRVQTCRVHDTLHAFCQLQAEKLNFYYTIDKEPERSISIYRRICIHANVKDYIFSRWRPYDRHVRTFLTLQGQVNLKPREAIRLNPSNVIEMDKGELKLILQTFRKLRVLEVSSLKFPRLPSQIEEMGLLRYFAFSCDFKYLPPSIGSLWSLQTLIVLTSEDVLKFPEHMWKLTQLRHLHSNASTYLPPPPKSYEGIGCDKLLTLSTIAPESCTENVLSWTPNINKLGVRGNVTLLFENRSKLIDNIKKLQHLKNLKLLSVASSNPSVVNNISISFPKTLKKLTLSGTTFNWEHISILGALEMLVVLKFKDNAFMGLSEGEGGVWKVEDGSFLSLKVLYMETLDLMTWVVSGDGQFSCLKHLVIKNCNRLEELPSCLVRRKNFDSLLISNCSPSLVNHAKKLVNEKTMTGSQVGKSSGGWKLSIDPPNA